MGSGVYFRHGNDFAMGHTMEMMNVAMARVAGMYGRMRVHSSNCVFVVASPAATCAALVSIHIAATRNSSVRMWKASMTCHSWCTARMSMICCRKSMVSVMRWLMFGHTMMLPFRHRMVAAMAEARHGAIAAKNRLCSHASPMRYLTVCHVSCSCCAFVFSLLTLKMSSSL